MLEIGWLHCTRPKLMLGFLRGKISEGKLRRFKIACCRSGWHLLTDDRLKKTVEAAEAFTDGVLTGEAFDAAKREGAAAYGEIVNRVGSGVAIARAAQAACCAACDAAPGYNVDAYTYAIATMDAMDDALGRPTSSMTWSGTVPGHEIEQAALLRDIVGNPFRPVAIDPAWRTPTVTSLASAAREERILPSGELDAARLAVLADALEEAGCDGADVLSHLRLPGPHVLGCWAVDLCLGLT
jgi:hypothetical protein